MLLCLTDTDRLEDIETQGLDVLLCSTDTDRLEDIETQGMDVLLCSTDTQIDYICYV